MKTLLLTFFALLATLPVFATEEKSSAAPRLLQPYTNKAEAISKVSIRVELGDSPLTGEWTLSQTEMHVFLGKLQHLKHQEHPYDIIFSEIKSPSKRYGGLELSFTTTERDLVLPTMVFHEGYIRQKDGKILHSDPGRLLEYWLWGTAKDRVQQQIGINVLNVFTFDQCVELGHVLIETDPRQCLLPNTIVMLDLGEIPTLEAIRVSSFEECLISGTAIINSFPRRCMVAGGKLYAEPPRQPDGRMIPERDGVTEF